MILVTDRLELRPHGVEDFADSLGLWADPEVARFVGGRPSSESEAWARLLRYGGLWRLLGFGYWVARERGDGRFVGELGFGRFHRGLGADFDDDVEVGWALVPTAWGRGLATEGLTAALRWIDAAEEVDRLVGMIDPRNAASIRLAQRLGFRRFAERECQGAATWLFERVRGGPGTASAA